MSSRRLTLRAVLTCLALGFEPARAGDGPPEVARRCRPPPALHFTPPAILPGLRPGSPAPRQLLFLDRCPGACTAELEDLAPWRVTISIPF